MTSLEQNDEKFLESEVVFTERIVAIDRLHLLVSLFIELKGNHVRA